MATYLFSSHDGFGLGHIRRNSLIARALLAIEPEANVALVTGTDARLAWLDDPRLRVVNVPPLLKDESGAYRSQRLTFEDAIKRRGEIFARTVEELRPDVVLVDRHPFGTAGELRSGLVRARDMGSTVLLGLRDILDEPAAVAAELAGAGWAGVGDLYDEALVYGSPVMCDHRLEYGIPLPLRYCGWVTSHARPVPIDPDLLVIASGGGADGHDVTRLGIEALIGRPDRRGRIVAGPYAADGDLAAGIARLGSRLTYRPEPDGCTPVFAGAGAALIMGGYNTTFEALAGGTRPIIVPRREPRREQVIRASRLAALGLADVVDAGVAGEEVTWLLDRPRRLPPGAADAAAIYLTGAETAAGALTGARVGAR